MSGETETNVSGWTTDTLREHMQRQINDQKEAVRTALSSAEKANDKAERAAESKFKDQNEFRDQLKDQAATFATRDQMEAIDKRLNLLELNLTTRLTEGTARTETKDHASEIMYTRVLSVAAILVSLIGVIAAVALTR